GIVGERGSVSLLDCAGKNPATLMRSLALAKRRKGFEPLREADMSGLEVRLASEEWPTVEELRDRHLLEDRISQALGWTGNGWCDGGDSGSGSLTIFCQVVEAERAVATVVEVLTEAGCSERATVVSFTDDEPTVLFPGAATL